MRHLPLVIAAIAACKSVERKPQEPKPATAATAAEGSAAAGRPVRMGEIRRPPDEVMLAVIVPADVKLESLEKLARDEAAAAKLTIEMMRSTARDLELTRERADYMLGGVDAKQYDAIERGGALLLRATQPQGIAGLRALSSVAAAVAKSAAGWVNDPAVGGLFTADAFAARIPAQRPDIRNLIVVHGVTDEHQEPYLDTMGMNRLGLPELYVRAAAPRQVDALSELLSATAQTLLERGDISRPGELDVDLAKLDASWGIDEIKRAGGTGRITWRVMWSEPDDGHGLHLELVPTQGAGIEGIAQTLMTFYGETPDPIVHLPADDPELLAAGERARKDLEAMRAHFAKGVPPGEQLAVKAPFTAPDGTVEWMWVDVTKWQRGELTGSLANEPELVTSLRVGAKVTVKLADIADFVHVLRDGTTKGGYSIEVMRKRGALPPQ